MIEGKRKHLLKTKGIKITPKVETAAAVAAAAEKPKPVKVTKVTKAGKSKSK